MFVNKSNRVRTIDALFSVHIQVFVLVLSLILVPVLLTVAWLVILSCYIPSCTITLLEIGQIRDFNSCVTDRRTDRPTDGRTDKGSHRVACPQLKRWLTIRIKQLAILPDAFLPFFFFLVADTQLYERLCPSVRWSVHWSVRWSVRWSWWSSWKILEQMLKKKTNKKKLWMDP